MFSGHDVTREFEAALAEYTGAKYAVTTTSCTMAIQIALAWELKQVVPPSYPQVFLPKFTYVGVPASVLNARWQLGFDDRQWRGEYNLIGSGVWDCARRFTSGMYRTATLMCVSFHWSKVLGLSQGGAILHDNVEADEWMRRYRFDGRREGVDPRDDDVMWPSVHAYLSPEVAAHGLMKLACLPQHNADLPNSDYPDCSKIRAFR